MKVRSLIERKGGTAVTLGKKTYLFAPDKAGEPHYCDIEDEGDIDTFLSVAEGFELLDPEQHADYIEQKALETAEGIAATARAIAVSKRGKVDKDPEEKPVKAKKPVAKKVTLEAKTTVTAKSAVDDKDIPDLSGI